MPAKIDIDALKNYTKSRLNETEYRQKVKNSQYQTQDLPVLKKMSVHILAHFWRFLKPKDLKLLSTYEFTHQQSQGHFTSIKKIIVWKSYSYFTLIQKYN